MKHIKLIIFAVSVCGVSTARAEGFCEPVGKCWVKFGGISYHLPHNTPHNEINYGLGGEYKWREDTTFQVGIYKNSKNQFSKYGAIQYHPFEFLGLRLGGTFMFVTGYKKNDKNGVTAAPLPTFSTELNINGSKWGLDGIVMPPMKGKEGLIAIGIKKAF